MADDYTPSEARVCIDYCNAVAARRLFEDVGCVMAEADAEFDRFIEAVKRDAAREALGSLQNFARECMDGEHGEIDHETFAGWHHTWAAAMQHRVTHYPRPEEAP